MPKIIEITVHQHDNRDKGRGYYIGPYSYHDQAGRPLPAASSLSQPQIEEAYWPYWNGQSWEQHENHKGETGYVNGDPYEVNDYGPYPEGWSANPPLPSLEEARTAALERLRMRKWAAKDAGIIVNGIAIDTDDKGQATISGAVTNVLMDPDFTARWKTSATNPDGTAVWLEIGKDVILALAKAMTAYTEACFAVEAVKQAQIATLQRPEDIATWLETELDQGWPGREYNMAPPTSPTSEGAGETGEKPEVKAKP